MLIYGMHLWVRSAKEISTLIVVFTGKNKYLHSCHLCLSELRLATHVFFAY
jgi:hypothetical protein